MNYLLMSPPYLPDLAKPVFRQNSIINHSPARLRLEQRTLENAPCLMYTPISVKSIEGFKFTWSVV
jgi:hypothetical protein